MPYPHELITRLKKMKKNIFALLLISILLSCSSSDDNDDSNGTAQTIATYNIVFTNFWNESDHGPLPSNPHWSPLVGVNHNSSVTFVESGEIASQGIEDIAENGVNTNFNNEVLLSIADGNAQQYISGSSLFLSSGSTIEINNVQINQNFPLLTLVSMIAPSPDWMIFVNGVNLRNSSNTDWQSSITIDLFVYDAGTDGGPWYTAPDVDLTPHIPINSLTGFTPFNNEKVGTLEITLQSVSNSGN